jgi:hypothetical protein
MDCSTLLGEQLNALDDLARSLAVPCNDVGIHATWRELRDRAAAHLQVREQIVLPVLQRGQRRARLEDIAPSHAELKRALAALCICEPGEPDFEAVLDDFRNAVQAQRGADEVFTVPTLRRLTTEPERRLMCEEIERLYEALIPPTLHYYLAQATGVAEDAAVVLRSLSPQADGPSP